MKGAAAMADDPKDPSAKDDPKDPKPTDSDLGEAGKKALEAERKARKAAEKSARDLEARLKELEDKDKSDSEKLTEKVSAAEKRAEEAELRAMRLEVAAEKGLTPAQAKRLVGTTRDEFEADADELLESFPSTESKGKSPSPKPKEDLKGGGDPTEEVEEMDPKKLAAMVPESY